LKVKAVEWVALVGHSENSLIVLHMRLSTLQSFCSWQRALLQLVLSPS
jgi:hypothetical protein